VNKIKTVLPQHGYDLPNDAAARFCHCAMLVAASVALGGVADAVLFRAADSGLRRDGGACSSVARVAAAAMEAASDASFDLDPADADAAATLATAGWREADA
jgi:hypothetical protein